VIEDNIFVLLGAPGAGKGTQAEKLAREFHLNLLGTGDLLREKAREETQLGSQVGQIIERGELVPDQLVADVVRERMGSSGGAGGFLLDGFPRNLAQADLLEQMVGNTPIGVINFRVDEEVLVKRLSGRRFCMECGKICNVYFSPPGKEDVCDACGAKLIHRPDDRPEVVRKRLEVYREKTEPLVAFYSNKEGFFEINGNLDPQAVFEEISGKLLMRKETTGNPPLSVDR